MNGSDLIVKFLENKGIKECYMVTGGGAMFLNDAFGRSKKIKKIFNHHEQACAMAALGSAKLFNEPTVVVPTTGCGGTNTITGLLDAWQDSNPVIFISGNVKQSECTITDELKLRKKGVQEVNIIDIVKSITKYSNFVKSVEDLKNSLVEAYDLAINGRPGPVWIDVPMDIQSKVIDDKDLDFLKIRKNLNKNKVQDFQLDLHKLKEKLNNSKRPIVVAGYGIHISHQRQQFINFINTTTIPFVSTYLGIDFVPTNHPYYIGRLGTKGDRAGNFSINKSDFVLVLGSSLNITVTGFQYDFFAKDAEICIVDIDDQEHKKNNINCSHFINSDLKDFFTNFNTKKIETEEWLGLCRKWKNNWPTFQKNYYNCEDGINMYLAVEMLHQVRKNRTIYVSDAGSAYYVTSQSLKIEDGDRYITSGAQADMGFTLPASIGVINNCGSNYNVIGITGDGSLQMNIQELALLKGYNLNIKLAVFNNKGYLSIRNSQKRFFNSRFYGTDEKNSLYMPSIEKIAKAYEIDHLKISNYSQLDELNHAINRFGPVIIEFDCPFNQEIVPTSSTKKLDDGTLISPPLDDMYPFLDREEYNREKNK